MSLTVPFYVDMDTTAVAVSLARFSQPFTGDNGEYVLQQDFQQFAANFVKIPLNTVHPQHPGYYLTDEGPQRHMDGGMIAWTRTYCAVPALRNDYSSLSYNFIGYYGKTADIAVAATFSVLGRTRKTDVVSCRLQNDYYLIGTGGQFTNPSGIPKINATKYYTPLGTINGSNVFVPTYAIGSANDFAFGTPVDFIYDTAKDPVTGATNSNPFPGAIIPTVPCRQAYTSLVISGLEIVAEPSVISRWRGNIYQRVTKYVVAQ